ncbi:competence protein (plasmid) [Rivularia sp. PCC 7116]|uniref:competence protein CoiA family protein n=1 Tax=Rivularia sp. PCC 7116 TaxID=373994 RepID=UPI00029EDC5C|nr:competence protein CoiA family protein [Rivularia sp. PCC 7116]AFY59233.1 competence protein [Rivularia sp. PCC 7116]
MDIAKSMFFGGHYVDVEVCNYNSYKELGLKCIECGEEVIVKQGDIRKHHFAHRQENYKLGVEECKLRTQNYISSFYGIRDQIISNKNQRSKILEDYFYYLITIYKSYYVNNFDEKCNKWYEKLKFEIKKKIRNKRIYK